MKDELCPASLAQLVSAFPNLTHLDICISTVRILEYRESLILLTKLQSLRIEQYRINDESVGNDIWNDNNESDESDGEPRTMPVQKMFPPSDYIEQFDAFLPSLPQLACIEIFLLANSVEFWDEEDFDLIFSPPAMRGSYHFRVNGGKAVLERATLDLSTTPA
ncbi:hypothetical protein B0H17DRAFT_1216185 [Mycena rosella]|uniref:F-box domain-containing protein n=1 Tax=Mycena rosella TaxID=1033263 RepID=A0AAD7FWI8_MYCRO|nr:hypothetical protein B0H17DRAFT_1216185 [Mycena rosella]